MKVLPPAAGGRNLQTLELNLKVETFYLEAAFSSHQQPSAHLKVFMTSRESTTKDVKLSQC